MQTFLGRVMPRENSGPANQYERRAGAGGWACERVLARAFRVGAAIVSFPAKRRQYPAMGATTSVSLGNSALLSLLLG